MPNILPVFSQYFQTFVCIYVNWGMWASSSSRLNRLLQSLYFAEKYISPNNMMSWRYVKNLMTKACNFFHSQKILFFVFNFSWDLFCLSIHMIRYEQEKMYVIERLCKYTIWILENFRLFTAFFVFIAKNRFSRASF